MLKYSKIINEETKECSVGLGNNIEFYKSINMEQMEVEQAYNGSWYLVGYAPEKPTLTKEEVSALREQEYTLYVDKITCHINRLKDEEQTEEVVAEIELLKQERAVKVEEIKQKYRYPTEE